MLKRRIQVPVWSIKVIKSGTALTNCPLKSNINHPSLKAKDVSDVPAQFVADPFLICHESKYYMFFEVLNKKVDRGEIGLATSADGEKWDYQKIVLSENYHLSYPKVFKVGNEFFMTPESEAGNGVYLYKARNFPFAWEKKIELLKGRYVDPTIFNYNNKWWMFAGSFDSKQLHLFYSDHIEGNWIEHPVSPVITENFNISRPAGRVINFNGDLFRYTQDGEPHYGTQVRSFKIKQLSETEYKEEEVNIILGGSSKKNDWRRDGMHHIDQLEINDNQWLIAVDGHEIKNVNYLKWKIQRFLIHPILNIKKYFNRCKRGGIREIFKL